MFIDQYPFNTPLPMPVITETVLVNLQANTILVPTGIK